MDAEMWAKTITLAFVILVIVSLAMCQQRTPDGARIYNGYPVVIEVGDGRSYACVRVPAGHSSAFIDCQRSEGDATDAKQ